MEITPKTRWQYRLQSGLFLILFLAVIGLLAWISHRYDYEADWTANGRNTLSPASVELLRRIPEPVTIVAVARNTDLAPTRRRIEELIARYQAVKPDIKLEFIDPDTEPDKVRQLQVTVDGELIVSYGNRSEHVTRASEETLTNTLQRLLRSGERKLVFLQGHGERDPKGRANHDYGSFIGFLESKGIKAEKLDLNQSPKIPQDTAVLVVAGPQTDYLPGEVKLIRDYLDRGGNLLWLHDPGALHGLDDLARAIHVDFTKGIIVDPSTQMLGIPDPSFVVITRYGEHAITRNFRYMTIYPRAVGIRFQAEANKKEERPWQYTEFLLTVERSWSETGPLKGAIRYDGGDETPGPLTVGLAMARKLPAPAKKTTDKPDDKTPPKPAVKDTPQPEQRIVVVGDGDFLSNAFLGNQGNQQMGFNIVNWLSHDDTFIAIPSRSAPDTRLTLSERTWSFLGLFFLFGLPGLLLGAGLYIWIRRRRQ